MSATIIDAILLVSTLLLSLGIGLYHALFKKQNTAKEYLQGGKNMNFFGIALSMGASLVSGVLMIALPAEIYYYGIQYSLQFCVLITPIVVFTYFCVCPVFFKLQLISIYTYMELRFDVRVKKLTSFLNAMPLLLYGTLIIYVTSLTIVQITSIDVEIISIVIAAICITYTLFGGFKAIIWTDAFQLFIMVASLITVSIVTIQQTGGIKNVADIVYNSDRLTIDFDMDPTKRDTFLATFCNAVIQLSMLFSFNQGIMQRFTSLKNHKDVKYVHVISSILWTVLCGLCILNGVIATARYIFCDPLSTKKIKKPDQIIPYIVQEIGNAVPGFSGIFLSGIISGGLSTLSTGLNSIAATLYIDFVKPVLSNILIEKYEILVIKLTVLTVGVLSIGLVYVVQHLGTVLSVMLAVNAIGFGSIFGIFVAGLFIPYINAKGAFWGGITTIILMGWLIATAQWYKLKGLIYHPTLPVYTSACPVNSVNETINFLTNSIAISSDEVPSIYKLSHHYYPVVGSLVLITMALIISYLTKDKNHRVREDLLSPILRCISRRKKMQRAYNTVEMALVVTDIA